MNSAWMLLPTSAQGLCCCHNRGGTTVNIGGFGFVNVRGVVAAVETDMMTTAKSVDTE